MATAVRSTSGSLVTTLFSQAYEFEFAQAVRILQSLDPSKKKVGEGDDPTAEAVRFSARVSFAVSASDIHRLDAGSPPTLTVTFLGIAGIQGPLPQVFTEILIERNKDKDQAGAAFLDVFNHRLTTFWYKLYVKLYPGLEDAKMEETQIGQSLLDLGGAKFRKNGVSLLPYGTLLWQSSKSALGLEELLHTFFKLECRVRPFEGGWNHVDSVQRSTLAKQFNVLGYDALLGGSSYNQAQGFRIVLGPLPYPKFRDFLPSSDPSSGYSRLKNIVMAYFESPPPYKIEVILQRDRVPPAALGSGHALGWNAWLNARRNYAHDGRVVIQ